MPQSKICPISSSSPPLLRRSFTNAVLRSESEKSSDFCSPYGDRWPTGQTLSLRPRAVYTHSAPSYSLEEIPPGSFLCGKALTSRICRLHSPPPTPYFMLPFSLLRERSSRFSATFTRAPCHDLLWIRPSFSFSDRSLYALTYSRGPEKRRVPLRTGPG